MGNLANSEMIKWGMSHPTACHLYTKMTKACNWYLIVIRSSYVIWSPFPCNSNLNYKACNFLFISVDAIVCGTVTAPEAISVTTPASINPRIVGGPAGPPRLRPLHGSHLAQIGPQLYLRRHTPQPQVGFNRSTLHHALQSALLSRSSSTSAITTRRSTKIHRSCLKLLKSSHMKILIPNHSIEILPLFVSSNHYPSYGLHSTHLPSSWLVG